MKNKNACKLTPQEILSFINDCTFDDSNYLHIKTTELAEQLILICNNFLEASILSFLYDSENDNINTLEKKANTFFLKLGLNVYLPKLFGETQRMPITFFFKDISELSFNPCKINTNSEIIVDHFTISPEECIFSCCSKEDQTKKIFIKSKELFIDDIFTERDEEDEDIEDEEENGDYQDNVDGQPLSIVQKASILYSRKQYQECIHLLEYEYYDLEKDAGANNLLCLCYTHFKNYNEAIHYINKAIELNNNNCIFYFNKALCLLCCRLTIDGIKCINIALSYADDEQQLRNISNYLIDMINNIMKEFSIEMIYNNELFSEHILFCDSIINLKYCFPELKEKYKKLKNEIIDYYYKETNFKYDLFVPNKDYKMLASRYSALLQVSDLPADKRVKIESLLKDCNESAMIDERAEKNETDKQQYIDDLISRGFSLEEIEESYKKKFSESYFPSYSVKEKIQNFKTRKSAGPMQPLPKPSSKPDAIRNMMEMEMSKSEMIEQLGIDYGISEESARNYIDSLYQDDELGLREYFDDNDFDDDETL